MQFEEYKILKNEIDTITAQRNTLTTFTITSVMAILAFTFNSTEPYIALTAYLIIIPVQFRILFLGHSIMKISSYISVFLEPNLPGKQWETMNAKLMPLFIKQKGNKAYGVSLIFRHFEFIFLSIGITLVFLFNIKPFCENWYHLIFPCIMLAIIIIISYCFRGYGKYREKYINLWKDI